MPFYAASRYNTWGWKNFRSVASNTRKGNMRRERKERTQKYIKPLHKYNLQTWQPEAVRKRKHFSPSFPINNTVMTIQASTRSCGRFNSFIFLIWGFVYGFNSTRLHTVCFDLFFLRVRRNSTQVQFITSSLPFLCLWWMRHCSLQITTSQCFFILIPWLK